MLRTTCLPALALAVSLTPVAHAGLVGVNSELLFDYGLTLSQLDSATIDLTQFGVGVFVSPLTGTTAGQQWSAVATTGIYIGALPSDALYISTFGGNDTLTINFAGPGVLGFGAHTFLTNDSDVVIPGNVIMRLSDGTQFAATVGGASSFYGWVSEGDVRITSIAYRPFLSGSGSFASLSEVRFAFVPSSGALAVLALGGVLAWRKRS